MDCRNVATLVCEARKAAGTIILADEALEGVDGSQIQALRDQQAPWSDIPLILLTRRGTTSEYAARWLKQLGQVALIERPVSPGPLLSAVKSALVARERQYEAREQLQALERVGEELRLANSRKDELLGLVSHELRTPLTGILSCSHLLLRRFAELGANDRQMLLQDISDHAVRLQRIIENMLILSRAESESETHIEPVLLQRMLPPVLSGLHGARELQVKIDPHLPPINANSVFLEQVIRNLVRNSEKYSQQDTPIEFDVGMLQNCVAITIADRGSVFEQAEVDRMFEAFYRDPEQSLKIGGLGLGLPVCKRLTEVQGGSIEAYPRPGGGLVVRLAFPVAPE